MSPDATEKPFLKQRSKKEHVQLISECNMMHTYLDTHTPLTPKELNSPSKGSEKSIYSCEGWGGVPPHQYGFSGLLLPQAGVPLLESWHCECQQLGLEPKHRHTEAPPAIARTAVFLAKCGYDPCHKVFPELSSN